MSYSDCNLSPEGEELSLDDCDALLKFPYQDYVPDKRKEVKFSDLPELGISADLVIDERSQSDISVDLTEKDVTSEDIKEIETCISAQTAVMKKLVELRAKLEDASTRNKAKIGQILEHLKKEEKFKSLANKCRVSKPIQLFAAPYFRDIKGREPPDNEDTITKTKNCDITAYHHPPKPWTLAEKDQLVEGVGANALSYVLKPYKAKRDFLKSKLKDKNVTDEDIANLKKQIIVIERQMKAQSERLYKDLVGEAKDHIDWMVISATNLEGNRTEEECELLWNNYLSPFVKKEPFTKAEDEHLKNLVENHNGRNWSSITEELDNNRSVIQVFERYQTKLNKELCKKYWAPEEDKKLLSLVEECKIGNYINWNAICCKMDGRSRYQIINRYERTLCANIRREPWSPAEDAMLYACVSKFGNKWTKMSEFFTGRPIYNIRERYVNTLDPDLRLGSWSKAEDMELIKLVKNVGYGRWSQISRHLPGRTDNMCYNRTKRLIIHSMAKEGDCDSNWETKDVSKLVDKLKPVASSKACFTLNAKLRQKQEKANDALKEALEKIHPIVDDTIDLETLNLSTVSLNTLRVLCKELGSSEAPTEIPKYQPKYMPFNGTPKKPILKPRRKRLRQEGDADASSHDETVSDDVSEDDVEIFDEERKFSDDSKLGLIERIWLKKVMEHKFEEEASIVYNTNMQKNKAVCLNTKETLEYNLYKNYLQKELQCQNYFDGDEIDYHYGGVDVNISMNRITHLFIQPVSKNDGIPPVLPPNFNTLHGLEMVFTTTNRLRRTADFLDHSLPYVRYMSGYSEVKPMCLACTVKRNEPKAEQTYEQIVKDMKSKMLIVDEVMHREAQIESQEGAANYPECQCEALASSKAQVELLARRFLSMFFYPYLLHDSGVSNEQEELIYMSKRPSGPPPRPSVPKAPKSRKPKSHLVPRKKNSTQNARRKRSNARKAKFTIKQESSSESSENESILPDPTPSTLRRSSRSCVLNRKSFIKTEKDSDGDQEMT